MAEERLVITDFSGGFGRVSDKKDIPASAQFVQSLSPHDDPTNLVPFPKAVKAHDVSSLPKWMVDGSPWDSNRYLQDANGNLYKETSAGVWSTLRSESTIESSLSAEGAVAGGYGLGLYGRYLYYAMDRQLGMYGPLDGTPTASDAGILEFHAGANTDQEADASGSTYTLPTSINEGAAHRKTFTPAKESLSSIEVHVNEKGSHDWTLTLHDAADHTIATSTLNNGDITDSTLNTFAFDTTKWPRLILGADYHFHLTVPSGTSKVTTNIASDLESVGFATHNAILVPDAIYHPMKTFLNFLCIGNDQYLAVWDESTLFYNPCALVLPAGYQIRALAQDQEFLVIGAAKGDGHQVEDAYLFYWDGIAPTFNFYKQIPMGLPNTLHNSKNRLMGIYGHRGDIYLGSDPFQRVQRLPRLNKQKTVEVYPGAITEWQGLTMFGIGKTDDADLVQGVYAWGSKADELPEVGVFAIPISSGNTTSTNIEIGLVQAFGTDLYIGWQDADGTSHGVDKVQLDHGPVSSVGYDSLIFDNGDPIKQKLALAIEMTMEPLVSGDSFALKYRIDRGSWETGNTITEAGTTKIKLGINKRFQEIEFGFVGTASTSTYPKVTSLALYFDPLASEGANG